MDDDSQMMDDECSPIIVNVADIDGRNEVDHNIEEIVLTIPEHPSKFRLDEDSSLALGVSEYWRTKCFSDVEIYCGVDGGIVDTHKLVLAGLSPFLKDVLLTDNDNCPHEKCALMIPDIDSDVLKGFLAKVCLGMNEIAVMDTSLAYLDFQWQEIVKNIKEEDESDYNDGTEIFHSIDDEMTILNYDETVDTEWKKRVAVNSIWSSFDKIDSLTAKCRHCLSIIKTFNGRTSGLERHLRSFHQEISNSRISIEPAVVEKRFPSKKLKRRSVVWNFCKKTDPTTATCTLCGIHIKMEGSNTSGIWRHLKRYHSEIKLKEDPDQEMTSLMTMAEIPPPVDSIFISESVTSTHEPVIDLVEKPPITDEDDDGLKPYESDVDENDENSGMPKSQAWSYFVRESKAYARCTLCKVPVSTTTNKTFNIKRHLQRKHITAYRSVQAADTIDVGSIDNFEIDESLTNKQRSFVWAYFKKEDKMTAICNICHSKVRTAGSSTSGMTRHLKRSHADEYFKVKDKLFEKQSDNNTEMDSDPPIDVRQFFESIQQEHEEDQILMDNLDDLDDSEQAKKVFVSCKTCSAKFDNPDTRVLWVHVMNEHRAEYQEAVVKAQNLKPPRSQIWNYFRRTIDKNRNACITCGSLMMCANKSTTAMIRHLQRKHEELYTKYLEESGNQAEIDKIAEDQKEGRKGNKRSRNPNDLSNRTCNECGKVFWHKRAMNYHQKIVHTGIRPYKCRECDASFARMECFQKHSHTDTKAFLCSMCGKTFAAKSARDLHERAHTGDKRYACTQCGKLFMTNQSLVKHERIHKGEKPFPCMECGRQFTQEHQLKTHIRIHTGEKPYTCDFCDLTFRHLSSRNKHKCESRSMAIKWIQTHDITSSILQEEDSIIESD